MAKLTKYAGTVTQTTGGSYRSWSNLANIKNNTVGSYATSNGRIKGKSSSPNRPSPVMCTNFGFNLPTGAEVSKVIVEYRHRKEAYDGHVPNIPAPTISLLGVTGFSSKGSAPTTTLTTYTKSFNASKISRSQVNSSSFGVKIDYPANTNSYEGTMSISLVRVTVEYKTPSYTVSVKKASGGYNNEEYAVECSISNKNLTAYNPTLTLSAPAGFSYKRAEGTGTATRVNNRTVTWDPSLTAKTGTSTIRMVFDASVTYPSGQSSYTGTFTLSESLYSSSKSLSATITDRPSGEGTDVDPDEPLPDGGTGTVTEQAVITVMMGNEFILNIEDVWPENIPYPYAIDLEFSGLTANDISYDGNYYNKMVSGNGYMYMFKSTDLPLDGNWIITKPSTITVKFTIEYGYEGVNSIFFINVLPPEEDLTIPFFSILEPSEEEYDRLGTGYTYICQSDIKHTTSDTNARDWYKNNRIGIFNNAIEGVSDYTSLTTNQIYENALYWANSTGGVNEYNSVECEFTYNEDYPLYILMTGDYPEATTYGYDIGTVKYNEPCIIEKNSYNGREANGNYPVPIENLLSDTDSSTITLTANETGTPVRLYDFPLDDDYGTNESLAIRGIQVTGTLESSDNLILHAKLIDPNGEIGQRSVVLNTNDTDDFSIGGLGDLWGFTTLQMTNLEDWQIELSASNILGLGESFLNINDIQIIFYVETVENNSVIVKIEGENLAYYGATVQDLDIPEGLETDTGFLNINGTDTNDVHRQNIRGKTITLELSIDTCDIKTSTDMLRQLVKLITTVTDKFNRSIPKIIEFSHKPQEYYEYITEKPFDITNNITGYTVKVTLTVPAGTSYSQEDTITNVVGNAGGLAAVRPIITIQPSDETIEIKEALSGQAFNMGYAGDWNDKIVEINCDDRIVLLKKDADDEGIDISRYVDHNVDWFRLQGEFQFEAVNCIIRTVSFNERW